MGDTERTVLGLPAAGPPVVQINGNGLSGDGLVLGSRPAGGSVSGTSSAGSAIIGLDIYNFKGGSGIHIQTNGNMITDNFLGTDVNGTAAGPGNGPRRADRQQHVEQHDRRDGSRRGQR